MALLKRARERKREKIDSEKETDVCDGMVFLCSVNFQVGRERDRKRQGDRETGRQGDRETEMKMCPGEKVSLCAANFQVGVEAENLI